MNSKSVVTPMRFTIEDKHLIKWMWVEKNYVEKRLLKMFLAEDEALMGKETGQNISARPLTLLCGGVGIVWSTTTWTRVSDATAVTFSVKCFDPLKLYLQSGNIFRKWFASYFFICSRALNKYWSPTANIIAVMTLLLTSGLHRCYFV